MLRILGIRKLRANLEIAHDIYSVSRLRSISVQCRDGTKIQVCAISRLACNFQIPRMRSAISRLRKFLNCTEHIHLEMVRGARNSGAHKKWERKSSNPTSSFSTVLESLSFLRRRTQRLRRNRWKFLSYGTHGPTSASTLYSQPEGKQYQTHHCFDYVHSFTQPN